MVNGVFSRDNTLEHEQLGVLLRIPETLKQQIVSAASRQQGFLMQDDREIVGSGITTFRFSTDAAAMHRE
jgi:hypothetical protein